MYLFRCGKPLADAILDRITHDAYRINIESIENNGSKHLVVLLFRTGGSRHIGTAAPPHKNIHEKHVIYSLHYCPR